MTNDHAKQNDLLNEQQAAKILKVKPRTVRSWRQKKALPYLQLTRRVIRFRRADLDEWIGRHRVAIVRGPKREASKPAA